MNARGSKGTGGEGRDDPPDLQNSIEATYVHY
jgi:hypothetical protein